jgi:hypothetical protein
LPFNAPKCDAKGQQMARKGDVTAAMTFIQGGKVDHGRPRPWSLAPPELTLIMRNSAWVALICVSGTDGHRSPQQLRRHQKKAPARMVVPGLGSRFDPKADACGCLGSEDASAAAHNSLHPFVASFRQQSGAAPAFR